MLPAHGEGDAGPHRVACLGVNVGVIQTCPSKHKMCGVHGIMNCDADIRTDLFRNIVLAGSRARPIGCRGR